MRAEAHRDADSAANRAAMSTTGRELPRGPLKEIATPHEATLRALMGMCRTVNQARTPAPSADMTMVVNRAVTRHAAVRASTAAEVAVADSMAVAAVVDLTVAVVGTTKS
jgi:hypothetical protein